MRAEDYFATEWPAELPRLRRLVVRSGISTDAVDDVLQEAALRLYTAWDRVFEDRPMKPLVNTIVLNVARDHHRRNHYEVRPVAEVPDGISTDARGAEQVVMARLELARTGRALGALSEQQRRIVVSAVADELAGEQHGRIRAPAATRMAITRARRRLVEVLEVTAAAIGVGCALVRQASTRRGVRPAVAVGALALAAAVLFGAAGASASGGAPASASETTPVASTAASGRSGVSQWQYHDNATALDLGTFAETSAGTSRWNWDTSPLLWVGLSGANASVGRAVDASCNLSLAQRLVEVRYPCLPVTTPATSPSPTGR